MTDKELEEAVAEFLDDAESVYDEYDQGYVDADAALSMLSSHLDTLEETAE